MLHAELNGLRRNRGSVSLSHLLRYAGSHLFDDLLRLCLQEDDDRVKLSVIQTIHGIRRDVEQCVLAPVHHFPDGAQPNDAGRFGILSGAVLHLTLHFYEIFELQQRLLRKQHIHNERVDLKIKNKTKQINFVIKNN